MNNWIAVLSSPRRGKNSELLMDYYIQELENQGRKVEKIVLSEIDQNPCKVCESCIKNGVCCYNDDANLLFNKLTETQHIHCALALISQNSNH